MGDQHESGEHWADRVASMPESITVDEAAVLLRMHPGTIRRLAASGEIPATKLGGHWRFRKSKLLELLGIESD